MEIKFSKEYTKFPVDYHKSKIIQVLRVHKSQLTTEFVNYDTTAKNGLKYELDDKVYLMIFLLTKHNELWTTLRKWDPEKEARYNQEIGKYVDCVLIEENEDDTKNPNHALNDFDSKGRRVMQPF